MILHKPMQIKIKNKFTSDLSSDSTTGSLKGYSKKSMHLLTFMEINLVIGENI